MKEFLNRYATYWNYVWKKSSVLGWMYFLKKNVKYGNKPVSHFFSAMFGSGTMGSRAPNLPLSPLSKESLESRLAEHKRRWARLGLKVPSHQLCDPGHSPAVSELHAPCKGCRQAKLPESQVLDPALPLTHGVP